jgi:terminase large subunit-like protein
VLIAHDIARACDPVLFAEACGVVPDKWQADLLRTMPRRGLLNCSRQSGKTTTCSLGACHTALYLPGSLTVIVSPSQRQSAEMLRTCRGLLAKLENAPELPGDSVLKLEFPNRSRILALPGTGDTIRGLAGAALVIIDEASRVPDELLAAVRPMTATSNGSIIALTTPAGKRGWFYEAWHNGDPIWHRVRISADQCPRITRQFLDEERKALGESKYREEYMLEFLDSTEAAFSTDLIDSMFTPDVKPLWPMKQGKAA